MTTNEMTPADFAAINGNDNGWGGDNMWWLILLFLVFGGGWNNGYGNGNCGVGGEVQRGFDQSAIMGGLNGLTSAVTNGFANAEISRANSNMNLIEALNGMSMAQQQCCCDTRASIADLKYTVATEACADRSAISDGVRDIIASNTASTQAILDKLCQQEIDALKTQNANLQTQINMANLTASQTAQTAQILADNSRQTSALEQYLNPAPIPAYVVQNPNCCTSPCGCNTGCGM